MPHVKMKFLRVVGITIEEPSDKALKVEKWAGSFMQQLMSLLQQHNFRLALHPQSKPGDSKFLALSLDPDNGMSQLQGLRQLRTVAFSDLLHPFRQGEIEWMRQFWPRLISIEVPILRETSKDKMEMQWIENYTGQVPTYDDWFPGLKVVVPNHCYGNWFFGYFGSEFNDWEWANIPEPSKDG
ncbi:hypothetical protein BGZ59_000956 [Podila verticillata]|nr:hypothetical protein BGZ59_000956 [Podila verticillata]